MEDRGERLMGGKISIERISMRVQLVKLVWNENMFK